MSKSTRSNNKSKAGGSQASNRQKHRAHSDSLIDLNSSADETPPVTLPNKRAKNDGRTVMDVDQTLAEGSSNPTQSQPAHNIAHPTSDSIAQQKSADSQNTQLTPEIPLVDLVPPIADPLNETANQSPLVDPNRFKDII